MAKNKRLFNFGKRLLARSAYGSSDLPCGISPIVTVDNELITEMQVGGYTFYGFYFSRCPNKFAKEVFHVEVQKSRKSLENPLNAFRLAAYGIDKKEKIGWILTKWCTLSEVPSSYIEAIEKRPKDYMK